MSSAAAAGGKAKSPRSTATKAAPAAKRESSVPRKSAATGSTAATKGSRPAADKAKPKPATQPKKEAAKPAVKTGSGNNRPSPKASTTGSGRQIKPVSTTSTKTASPRTSERGSGSRVSKPSAPTVKSSPAPSPRQPQQRNRIPEPAIEPPASPVNGLIGSADGNGEQHFPNDDERKELPKLSVRPPTGLTGPGVKPVESSGTGEDANNGPEPDKHNSNSTENSHGSTRMARPTTARAAPPKVLRKQELEMAAAFEQEERQRLAAAEPVVNLMKESRDNGANDDEDSQFVVELRPVSGTSGIGGNEDALLNTIEAGHEHQKGSLVKQLVDTKRELEGELATGVNGVGTGGSIGGNDNEPISRLAARDIEKLRQNIQQLSRLANPLGRVLEYLQEDIDQMFAELRGWQEETESNLRKLDKERSSIDSDLVPLRSQLEALDQEIVEQQEKISSTKGNIIRNDQRLARITDAFTSRFA